MTDADLSLTPSAEKPRLSEVIDYERDIAPYQLTMIYAGVGSGKNTLAGHLMTGCKELNLIPDDIHLWLTTEMNSVANMINSFTMVRFIDMGLLGLS